MLFRQTITLVKMLTINTLFIRLMLIDHFNTLTQYYVISSINTYIIYLNEQFAISVNKRLSNNCALFFLLFLLG